MKSIIAILLVTTIGALAQQPASPVPANTNSLEITATNPKTHSSLATGEKLKIKIHYNNPGQNPVRIFARPYTAGKLTAGYRAHASLEYSTGSGDVEGWFYFDGSVSVDEVVVFMVDSKTSNLVATTKLPVQFTWK